MIVRYNLDFLIAALILLVLLWLYSQRKKKLEDINSMIFRCFILVGMADVLLDLTCTAIILKQDTSLNAILGICLHLFYLIQMTFPYAFLGYVQSLRTGIDVRIRKVMCLAAVPFAVMILLVLTNPWHEMLFYFDEMGQYTWGPWYMASYVYVLLYILYAVADSIVYRRQLGERKLRIIWSFLAVTGTCIAVQAFYPVLLMTGFGLALGISVLYLTINNPSGYEDSLTGALDNLYFSLWMQEQMNCGKSWNLLSVDLREIKRINKVYGGVVGDDLLCYVVERLKKISGSEYVFRLTGKRFLLLASSLEEYERKRLAVQKFFEEGFRIRGELIHPEVVICGVRGNAVFKKSVTLLEYMDYLVSLAPGGEKMIVIQGHDKTLQDFFYEREIELFLGTAVAEDLFEVYFQPVYSIRNGRYITLEALSRLRHPHLGPVPPDVFIGIAEKSGQIVDLGYLQFRRICRFVKAHPEIMEYVENIKINLSPVELLKDGYAQKLIELLEEYELPGSLFQVEITETVATEYSDSMYRAVSRFVEAGMGLCMDDFGAGYANLNSVLRLPFTVVKLDRSLLEGICEEEQKALFYHSIVAVLQNVGYYVVAEGAETEEEVRCLKDWGVDMVQGYYFSPPVPAEKILGVLKKV